VAPLCVVVVVLALVAIVAMTREKVAHVQVMDKPFATVVRPQGSAKQLNGQARRIRVFISYRRNDTRHIADRIYERLGHHFGPQSVFKDLEAIPLGEDFRRILQEAVGRCDVLLAVIGERWLDRSAEGGEPRLHDTNDFIRLELEGALKRGIRVIPLLADGATMPLPNDLPPSLQELAFRQGAVVRPDPDFHRDMDRLILALEEHHDGSTAV
jgi:hypothetical protein